MKNFAQALAQVVKENTPAPEILVFTEREFKDFETCSCGKADSRFDIECTNCGDMFT